MSRIYPPGQSVHVLGRLLRLHVYVPSLFKFTLQVLVTKSVEKLKQCMFCSSKHVNILPAPVPLCRPDLQSYVWLCGLGKRNMAKFWGYLGSRKTTCRQFYSGFSLEGAWRAHIHPRQECSPPVISSYILFEGIELDTSVISTMRLFKDCPIVYI